MTGPTATELDARIARIVESQGQLGNLSDDVAFATIDSGDVRARLSASVDPFFGGFGWTRSALPGEVITGRVSVEFPSPAARCPRNRTSTYTSGWDPAASTPTSEATC